MQLVVYVKCYRPRDGEMRLSLIRDIPSLDIAETLLKKEEARFTAKLGKALRRWEIEEEN